MGDVKDEIFDMVKPKEELKITLKELIDCKVRKGHLRLVSVLLPTPRSMLVPADSSRPFLGSGREDGACFFPDKGSRTVEYKKCSCQGEGRVQVGGGRGGPEGK